MKDILNRREDLMNNTASQLIGLSFTTAREKLSFWWVLEHQNIQPWGSRYTFRRTGVGQLTLYTNSKNIVTQTPTKASVLLQKPVHVQL
jgi:hypothetical protein